MKFQNYKNLSGDSGVSEYAYGDNWIKVKFKGGCVYTYNYSSAGKDKIEQMKELADKGKDLSAFITKNLKDRDKKEKYYIDIDCPER